MTIKITEIDVSKGTQEDKVLTGKEAEELLARQEKMTEKYNALLNREAELAEERTNAVNKLLIAKFNE